MSRATPRNPAVPEHSDDAAGQRSCCASLPGLPSRSEAHVSARDQVTTTTDQGSVLWTLEEIGRLVSHSGNPAETLDQHRSPDQAAVRYRRLLGLSAGAGSGQPGAGRHDRPAARERRPRPDAAHRRPGGPRRRAAAAAGLADATTHPRFKYFREAGEDPYRSFLGVPILDRGLLQGVLVVQTVEPPDLQPGRRPDARHGRHAAGADRQRSADARPIRRAGASAAVRARAEPLVELGQRHDEPVPRARSGPVARVRSQPDRAAAADPDRGARGAGVSSSSSTAASTTPIAGCRST